MKTRSNLLYLFAFVASVATVSYFYNSKENPIYITEAIKIHGDSMIPLIKSGDTVIHAPNYYFSHRIRYNDIVIFRSPLDKKLIVKRVLAVAGDQIEMKDWALYINGNLAKNSQNIEYEIRSDVFKAMVSMSPTVPENSVLLMGESRKGSVDSSRLGFISTSAIVSRVISY